MGLSIYGELKKVDFANAINSTVELALPCFTKDKVLICSVRMEAENYKTNHKVRKIINIVYYRASGYTFVGTCETEDSTLLAFNTKPLELERFSYHDSCWRSDGTERIISKTVETVLDKLENEGKGYSVYTSFGFIPYKIIDAKVKIEDYDSTKKSMLIPIVTED